MDPWRYAQLPILKLHQNDLLREMEMFRLAQEARSMPRGTPRGTRGLTRLYGPILVRFGYWLMLRGARLQARYGILKLSALHLLLLSTEEEERSGYASDLSLSQAR